MRRGVGTTDPVSLLLPGIDSSVVGRNVAPSKVVGPTVSPDELDVGMSVTSGPEIVGCSVVPVDTTVGMAVGPPPPEEVLVGGAVVATDVPPPVLSDVEAGLGEGVDPTLVELSEVVASVVSSEVDVAVGDIVELTDGLGEGVAPVGTAVPFVTAEEVAEALGASVEFGLGVFAFRENACVVAFTASIARAQNPNR